MLGAVAKLVVISDVMDTNVEMVKKSRNSDTLGPVELIVCPEQGNQGDWLEHDGQGEVSIIIFAYQIIVADAADAVSVNFSGRCKFLQI